MRHSRLPLTQPDGSGRGARRARCSAGCRRRRTRPRWPASGGTGDRWARAHSAAALHRGRRAPGARVVVGRAAAPRCRHLLGGQQRPGPPVGATGVGDLARRPRSTSASAVPPSAQVSPHDPPRQRAPRQRHRRRDRRGCRDHRGQRLPRCFTRPTTKYDWHYDADTYGPFTRISPGVVKAWRAAGVAGRDSFQETGRWELGGQA